jgi:hypothetical protein
VLAEVLTHCQLHNCFSFKGLQAMLFQGEETEQKNEIAAPPVCRSQVHLLSWGKLMMSPHLHAILPLGDKHTPWKPFRGGPEQAEQSSAAAINITSFKKKKKK